MGLFSRQDANHSNSDEEDLQLPTRDDFQQPLVDEVRAKPTGKYSIEDAIELVRRLPTEPDENTMNVICQTLESAKVKTTDILQDAQHKEQRIRRQHRSVEQEIERLQTEVNERQNQLGRLADSLEELLSIKARFEKASASAQPTSPEAEPSPQLASEPSDKEPESISAQPAMDMDSEPETDPTPISAGRRSRGAPR